MAVRSAVVDEEGAFRTWVTPMLRSCAMSFEQIGELLRAEDPETVRRHLELHVEWLEERLDRQRRLLGRVERALTGPAGP